MLFPLPLAPTSAVVLPSSNTMLMLSRTCTVGRAGYLKFTLRSSIRPLTVEGESPSVLAESMRGSRAIISRTSLAAAEALVKSPMEGAMIVRLDVAMMQEKKTLDTR